MSLPVIIRANEGEQYNTYTTEQFDLGSQLVLGPDGRAFKFVLNGAVALGAATLIQGKAGDDQLIDMDIPTNAAIGDKTFTVTNGTTALADGELVGAYIVLYTVGTPSTLGHSYRVFGNSSAISGAAITFTLDPNSLGLIRTVTASTDDADCSWNPASGVVVSTGATPSGPIVGVAPTNISAAEYGWIQTKGLCGVLVDDGAALDQGDAVSPGPDPGSVLTNAADDVKVVGFANTNSAVDEYGIITLTLD